ncbi:hypothetical protein [Streptomyces sp. ISL-36]|uniref:hypothetical protein n=1 Tax=Streptomyces sp. ISL-36 TaxID=2819182 RepID=UPI0020351583|nr:hypothetical protein [Streptomyces sp. ISL-36]
MAERDDDRDGLRLDRLHLRLGPALPDWPTGLVLDVAVQGDVIQRAETLVVAAPARTGAARLPFWSAPWLFVGDGSTVPTGVVERRRCAAHLDSLGRLLSIAGWAHQAGRARALRDAVLVGAMVTDVDDDVRRFARRVRSSRLLRGLLTGLGHLSAARAGELGVTGPALIADGDVWDRLLVWLDETQRSLKAAHDGRPWPSHDLNGPRGRLAAEHPPSQRLLRALPELVTGAEFACARLIVASLDPDLDELAPTAVAHG